MLLFKVTHVSICPSEGILNLYSYNTVTHALIRTKFFQNPPQKLLVSPSLNTVGWRYSL